jgi:hypothetical protein
MYAARVLICWWHAWLGHNRTFVKVTYPFEPKDSRDKWHQQESHPAFRTEKSFKWKVRASLMWRAYANDA